MDEPIAIAPLWLEYSGLPQWLSEDVRQGAWTVFRKIVELDCQHNAIPDVVEASIESLTEWTGLKPDVVRRIVKKLRSKKLIACYLPDTDEEPALLQIQIPLKTPVPPSKVLADSDSPLFRPGMKLRYAYPIEEPPGDETRLQQVVDLYFNNISMRMNAFILDELRLVARRFTLDDIRRVFGAAGQNDTHQLSWAVRQLSQLRRAGENAERNESVQ